MKLIGESYTNYSNHPSGHVKGTLSVFHQEKATPGSSSCTFTVGTRACSSAGWPVNAGNVPQCMGMTDFACNNRQATAASRGPIVYRSPIERNASSGSYSS